jgi:hypothetical protein
LLPSDESVGRPLCSEWRRRLNYSPIVLGADPQGATDRRYFFKGKIQQVMVPRWRNH